MKILFNFLKSYFRFKFLQLKFNLSTIYYPTSIDNNTELDRNTVIFKNVKLIDCVVGRFSYIQENSFIYNTNIGPFCSIAPEVVIGLIDHPKDFVSTSPVFYDKKQPLPFFFNHDKSTKFFYKKTLLGADCWIGQRVMIKAGVQIGVGSIIGAGSIVTNDVEPYSIIAGIPGKIIGQRFNNLTIEKLKKSQWWNLSEDKLKNLSPIFNNPKTFLSKINEKHTPKK